MIYVHEIIGRIIDEMRKDGSYTSFSNVLTTYTLQSVNTLVESEWISITGFEDFQVQNVTSTAFDIISQSDPPGTGDWNSLEPFYIFGHRREIANRLLMKDKDGVFKFQKYPLFALRLPITQIVSTDKVQDVSLNIAILDLTQKNFRSDDRYENVIKPILMPLYLDFFDKLENSFEIMNIGTPVHQRVDRLFYGITALEGNEAYIFADPLDGIELVDLELKLNNNNC
jgi:hypothetical protein